MKQKQSCCYRQPKSAPCPSLIESIEEGRPSAVQSQQVLVATEPGPTAEQEESIGDIRNV